MKYKIDIKNMITEYVFFLIITFKYGLTFPHLGSRVEVRRVWVNIRISLN